MDLGLPPNGWENERASAFDWLMEDPDNRAIDSPTELDAVLNLMAARTQFPGSVFTMAQFCFPRQPSIGRDQKLLPFHLYVF